MKKANKIKIVEKGINPKTNTPYLYFKVLTKHPNLKDYWNLTYEQHPTTPTKICKYFGYLTSCFKCLFKTQKQDYCLVSPQLLHSKFVKLELKKAHSLFKPIFYYHNSKLLYGKTINWKSLEEVLIYKKGGSVIKLTPLNPKNTLWNIIFVSPEGLITRTIEEYPYLKTKRFIREQSNLKTTICIQWVYPEPKRR